MSEPRDYSSPSCCSKTIALASSHADRRRRERTASIGDGAHRIDPGAGDRGAFLHLQWLARSIVALAAVPAVAAALAIFVLTRLEDHHD